MLGITSLLSCRIHEPLFKIVQAYQSLTSLFLHVTTVAFRLLSRFAITLRQEERRRC